MQIQWKIISDHSYNSSGCFVVLFGGILFQTLETILTPQLERKAYIVMNEKPQKCMCMLNVLSKPERTCWSLIPQLDTVVIEISLVKALNLRVNPQRLYRAKHLASQNGAYSDTEFYNGPTSYLNIKLHLLKMRIYWQSCNHIHWVTTKILLLT